MQSSENVENISVKRKADDFVTKRVKKPKFDSVNDSKESENTQERLDLTTDKESSTFNQDQNPDIDLNSYNLTEDCIEALIINHLVTLKFL